MPIITFREEVSQLCAPLLAQSECNGGSLPGIYKHVYRDTITLPGNCNSWVFSYDDCCRNASNNLSGTGNDYYWESVLNSVTSPCNSSPVISANSIPYYCVNQSVRFNFNVYEPDGNTLVFSLIDAKQSSTTNVSYQFGFSGANPMAGLQINPNTGEITFLPTVIGNYVIAVLIQEYDNNGILVGSIIQDFQFEIINCTNNNPLPPSGISNFSGGVQLTNFQVEGCEGDYICFDVTFTDDATDSIFLSSNVDQLFSRCNLNTKHIYQWFSYCSIMFYHKFR